MIGELAGLGSALTWALVSLLLRGLQTRINALSLNAFRCLVAAVVTGLAVVATGRTDAMGSIPPSVLSYLMISTILSIGIGDTLFFYSLKMVGVARALPISNAYPIFAAIMAAAVLGEPITVGLVGGTLLVIVGIVLVMMPNRAMMKATQVTGSRNELMGTLLAVLAAFFWAASTTLLKLGTPPDVDSLAATVLRLIAASAMLGGASLFTKDGLQVREYRGRKLIDISLAGFCGALSSYFFLVAIQLTGAGKAATLTSTAPIFGAPLAVLLGEKVTWRLILGVMVSVVGIAMVVWA